jgi:hypothetical protein
VGRPCLPLFEALGRQTLGECMLAKGDLHRLQCLSYLGFPSGTARVSHVVLPLDQWEQGFFCPLPPYGGDGRVGQITPDPFPPEVHEGRQSR